MAYTKTEEIEGFVDEDGKKRSRLSADLWVYFDAADGTQFGEVKKIAVGHCIRDEVFEIFFDLDV
jgi:hypothetical protein